MQEHISYYCITTHNSCKVSIFFPFIAFTLQKIPASDQCNHLLSRLLDSNLDYDLLEETKPPHTMIHNKCGLQPEQAFSLTQKETSVSKLRDEEVGMRPAGMGET